MKIHKVNFVRGFGPEENPFYVEIDAEVLEDGEVNQYTVKVAGTDPEYLFPDELLTPLDDFFHNLIAEHCEKGGIRPTRDEPSLSAEERNPGMAGRH